MRLVHPMLCWQEDTRKALLASLQDDSFNLWVRDVSSGRHPNIPPVLNWPEASDESDSETSPSRIETAASLGAGGNSDVVELNDVDLQMPGFAGLGGRVTGYNIRTSDAIKLSAAGLFDFVFLRHSTESYLMLTKLLCYWMLLHGATVCFCSLHVWNFNQQAVALPTVLLTQSNATFCMSVLGVGTI